jgi:flagellar basal-body rod protein FlgG
MDGIALMATAMRAARARLDVSAANLANVSTDGFRKHVANVTLGPAGLVATSHGDAEQGPLHRTGRAFDLAVAGPGSFVLRDAAGRVVSARSGSFGRDAFGRLADERGRVVLGSRGALVVGADATIDAHGVVREAGATVGAMRLAPGTLVQSGFLEGANVDAIHEMVEVLDAQRAFETAQKTLSAIDEARQKDSNDVGRLPS